MNQTNSQTHPGKKMDDKQPNNAKWLLANIEAVVLAIIIALLVRHFCLEAFKIPSGSMEPTLIGDPRCGDRILVHKLAYYRTSPKRWDVIVFKYPNDTRRNFIKRLIGLPGEHVEIKNGDIYIDGHIARKPEHVQQALLYPISSLKQKPSSDVWAANGGTWTWKQDSLLATSEQLAWYQYLHRITNMYTPRRDKLFFNRKQFADTVGGDYDIGEIRLQFFAQSHSPQGRVLIEVREGINVFLMTLSQEQDCSLSWYRENSLHKTIPIAHRLIAQKKQFLCFSNLDDFVTIELDGEKIAHLDYSTTIEQAPTEAHEARIRIGVEGGSFSFSQIELWRDIHYIGKDDFFAPPVSWRVPANHYFALGDNPPNSRDSRDWERFCLFRKDGMSIQGDQSLFPDTTYDEFFDIYGRRVVITEGQLRETRFDNLKVPYVPQSYLIGRALAVFWPPPRVKIIR